MPEPLVSVVVPTYDRAALVGEAIASALAQDIDDLEVVVVDDGSTDGTREVVSRFDSRVRYLRQRNRGAAAARNLGVAAARGRYVAFLDSDDVWVPEKLSVELAIFARLPAVDAVISDSDQWQDGVRVNGSRFVENRVALPPAPEVPLVSACDLRWVERSLCSTSCMTLTRRAIEGLGRPLFDARLPSHEDWDLEVRLYHLFEVAVCRRVLASVRRFPDHTRRLRGTSRDHLLRQHRVLRRARRLAPPSAAIAEAIRRRRRDLARGFAAQAEGRQRLRCLPLAAWEALYGAPADALAVLALACGPRRPALD
jgi:hypothetical protein